MERHRFVRYMFWGALASMVAVGVWQRGDLGIGANRDTPTVSFERAAAALAASETDVAITHALQGLRQVPWYGPGWALYGVAVDRWLGRQAALAPLALALRLDPAGRSTIHTAAPPLIAAGRLSVAEALQFAARRPHPRLIRALPVTPPAIWLAQPVLHQQRMARSLWRAQRFQWLDALVHAPTWMQLDDDARNYALVGHCHVHPQRCLARLEPCLTQPVAAGCPVDRLRPEAAWAASDAAGAAGAADAALRWARRAAAGTNDPVAVRRLARRYRAAGNVTAANRLLRTHPAVRRR